MTKISSFLKSLKAPKVSLDRDSYFVIVLGFLLSRTVLAGSLAPFAPAFFAGLRRHSGTLSLHAAVAAVAGAATLGDWNYLAYNLLAMLLVAVTMRAGQGKKVPAVLDSLLAGGVVAISRAVAAAATAPSLYSYVSALLEGMCAVVIAALTQMAFTPDRAKSPTAMEKSSEAVLVVGLLSLGGLHGFSVYGIGLEVVAAMGCTLVAGFAAGPGGGAIAGLAAGLVVALTGNEGSAILGVLGVSGLLAGIGGWFGKTESVMGYLSGGLLMSLYAETAGDLTVRLAEQVISCAAILLVTKRAERMLADRFPVLGASRSAPRARPQVDTGSIKTAAFIRDPPSRLWCALRAENSCSRLVGILPAKRLQPPPSGCGGYWESTSGTSRDPPAPIHRSPQSEGERGPSTRKQPGPLLR